MGLYKGILTKGNRIEMDRIKKTENLFWEKFGINTTCQSCQKSCKQHAGVELVSCKMFRSNGGKIMKQEPMMMKTEDLIANVAPTHKPGESKAKRILDTTTGKFETNATPQKRPRAKAFIIQDLEKTSDQKTTVKTNLAKYFREHTEIQQTIFDFLVNTNNKKPLVGYFIEKDEEEITIINKKTDERSVLNNNSKVKSWMRNDKDFQHKLYKKFLSTINTNVPFLERYLVTKVV